MSHKRSFLFQQL